MGKSVNIEDVVFRLDEFIGLNGRKPRMDSEDVSERRLANLMYKNSGRPEVVGLLEKYGMGFQKQLTVSEFLNRIERFLVVNGYFPGSDASRDEEHRLYAFAKRLMRSDNTEAKSRLFDIIAQHDIYNTCDIAMDEEMAGEMEVGSVDVQDEQFYDRPQRTTDEEKDAKRSDAEIYADDVAQLSSHSFVDDAAFREACDRLMSGQASVKDIVEFPLDTGDLSWPVRFDNPIYSKLYRAFSESGMSPEEMEEQRDAYLLKARDRKCRDIAEGLRRSPDSVKDKLLIGMWGHCYSSWEWLRSEFNRLVSADADWKTAFFFPVERAHMAEPVRYIFDHLMDKGRDERLSGKDKCLTYDEYREMRDAYQAMGGSDMRRRFDASIYALRDIGGDQVLDLHRDNGFDNLHYFVGNVFCDSDNVPLEVLVGSLETGPSARLGSLREIAGQLKLGKDIGSVRVPSLAFVRKGFSLPAGADDIHTQTGRDYEALCASMRANARRIAMADTEEGARERKATRRKHY